MTEDGTPKIKKANAADTGVPDVYLNDSGNFRPGLDARYKSDLCNSALGIKNGDALMEFTPQDAETRLAKRGWIKFLDAKKAVLATKSDAAEKRKADKLKAEQEKAAIKASVKADKPSGDQPSGDEAPAKGDGTFNPDPKPTSKKK